MPASHYWGSGVLEWKVMTMKKRLASILFTSAVVAATVELGVSPASAGTTISLSYPVTGSTYINLTLPGPDNTITLTLGAATSG